MTPSGRYPPTDGTLPAFWGTLDWQAEHNPSRPWVIFPTPDGPEPTKSFSMSDFSLASHRVAHVLRPGRAGPDGEVVALLVHCDTIHYNALIAGCIRAGLVVCGINPLHSC